MSQQQYDNRNRFVLFKNDRKQDEKDPDYTGTFTDANNQEYFIDGWLKDTAKGKMMSGRVKPKTQRRTDSQAPRKSQPEPDNDGW